MKSLWKVHNGFLGASRLVTLQKPRKYGFIVSRFYSIIYHLFYSCREGNLRPPHPCGSCSAGRPTSANKAFPQGAEHVVGLWSTSMKYACPHPLAGCEHRLRRRTLWVQLLDVGKAGRYIKSRAKFSATSCRGFCNFLHRIGYLDII